MFIGIALSSGSAGLLAMIGHLIFNSASSIANVNYGDDHCESRFAGRNNQIKVAVGCLLLLVLRFTKRVKNPLFFLNLHFDKQN